MMSCREDATPKPIGYFRIDLPEHSYVKFDEACPLTMEVPQYSKVELFTDKVSEDSCWFNVYFPRFKARVYCTYMGIDNNFEGLVKDAYSFAAKHEMKASALKRTMVDKPEDQVEGIIYDIEGEAASQVQFFVTDSTNHFFRGSLYFNNRPNPDSIAPVLQFIRDDIGHMVNSVKWK